VTLPDRLALDTNCFIYLFEEPTSARSTYLEREIFRPAVGGQLRLVTSALTVAELLVAPHRAGRPAEARSLRTALANLPNLEIIDLDASLAADAAELRGLRRTTLADAIHVATARRMAEAFLTNDRRLTEHSTDVPVLILDDLLS
jgi:predicted nucleic acid-binding protein